MQTRVALRRIATAISLCLGAAPIPIAFAAEPNADALRFFETQVRPLLIEHCLDCHNADDASGNLRLDSRMAMLVGGESGAAIEPGKPSESLLVDAIHYQSREMPPDGKLSDEQIETLTRWVSIGAPWPGEDPNAPVRKREWFNKDDRSWWAIRPVASPPVPNLQGDFADWARNEIDHFIADAMQSEGLTPAPPADSHAIVRRLYLDVTGLPPTPEQVDAFVRDDAADAYESLVDRLLQSKGYGEHAARQWLDLVRYADSDGYRADGYRDNAWRYRDYVIDSFNEDKPYDRFVQEQIAGDELFPDDLDAQVALGYLRHWVYEWNIRDAPTQWKTILEDITDTTADVFMGLGLQCAKCHNHKFDPLLQKDYFRLQAFFAPIMPVDVVVADSQTRTNHEQRLKTWEAKTATLRNQIHELEQPYRDKYRDIAIDRFPDEIKAIARKPATDQTPYQKQLVYLIERQVQSEYDRLEQFLSSEDKERVVELRRELKAFEKLKPAPLPTAMGITDVGPAAPDVVMPRRSSDIVLPGPPSILDPNPLTIDVPSSTATTGRRSALAKWLTDASNPLSTRVIANRIWQSHFGRGLAENASDFGVLGGPPSHPDLLDWLTKEMIREGWGLKSLHRKILFSATYRQSAAHPNFTRYQQIDPANRFYWRRDTTRLSAEQIRDSLLLVTGAMQPCDGGSGRLPDAACRTIYTRVMRNSPDELLNSFDLPQFFASNSTRNTTTTPVQSLLMINSDRIRGHARALASIAIETQRDPRSQVAMVWKRVFGRDPSDGEMNEATKFLASQQSLIRGDKSDDGGGLIATAKLPYRDGQAVAISVDDDALQLDVRHDASMDSDEFTIETFFQLRSIAKTGAVRTLAGKWDGNMKSSGWRFGVTGAGSRRKPQTLVLQMVGQSCDSPSEKLLVEAAVFSDQHIQINTPYYASAVVRMPKPNENEHNSGGDEPGSVTFHLKDLSNDDEPLLTATVPHQICKLPGNRIPFSIGSYSGKDRQAFDGLIDDIRWVGKAIGPDEILQVVEREVTGTIGHWQFETVPGVMRNSVGDAMSIEGRGEKMVNLSPQEAALADFCHALLNSNEFLYVD